ncbi:MAG: hypothetical protein JXA03_09810 [Bacteroidales bacterium]|nr:hypothetical protein [Bacteroidales bacterium]
MKVSEIYRLEQRNRDCCYLIRDGIFWRAWEQSAFRFYNKIKPYQITKKSFKNIGATLVYLGFPATNLHRILEILQKENLIAKQSEEIITISGFVAQTGFEEWKQSVAESVIAVSESNSEYVLPQLKENAEKVYDVEEMIRTFPLASKTPLECQQFLHNLQIQLNGAL